MLRLSTSLFRRNQPIVSGVRHFAKNTGGLPKYTNLKEMEPGPRAPRRKNPNAKAKRQNLEHLNWVPRMVLVNVSGRDEIGIANRLFQCVDKLDGTVQENRMHTLGRTFNATVLTAIPDFHSVADLEASVSEEFPGYIVSASEALPAPMFTQPMIYLNLELQGPDAPGILMKFTDLLIEHDIAVQASVTDVTNQPFTGYRVLEGHITMACPTYTDFEQLQTDLDAVQEETGFEVNLAPVSEKERREMAEAQAQQAQEDQNEGRADGYAQPNDESTIDARFTDVTR